jgi:hypothetical protein
MSPKDKGATRSRASASRAGARAWWRSRGPGRRRRGASGSRRRTSMSTQQLFEQLSDAGWARRMREDCDRAERAQTPAQQAITATVMRRAIALGASGFALTGSTARKRRTAISDLDYHVIGQRPDVSDLPGDVDVVATSAARFRTRLVEGDDFIQWTLRCGCILYDAGAMRNGLQLIVEADLWPSGQRKLDSLAIHRAEVERLIQMGDQSAAHEQLRG